MPFWKNNRVTPARIILIGFLLLIVLGTLLLMLPFAARDGERVPFSDALFTAASATCVTGLVVRDTATCWSAFGQAVILVLIQIGGMGVVTMSVAVFLLTGRKLGLKQRWVLQESISAPQVGGIVRQTRFILKTAFCMEAAGAVVLAVRFWPAYRWRGLWYAVFHSVSAFCNAGFDLMGHDAPFSSLTGFAYDPVVTGTVTALILLGGLGFLTWQDVRENKLHWSRWRLQTKLILTTTAALLSGAFCYFLFYEFRLPQWQDMTLAQRLQSAWFQAVTPRTAGFNTVDLTRLSQTGQLLLIALMLVGGSPGSTAGGCKTTTLAVLLLIVRASFRRGGTPQCFGRRLADDTLRSACSIFLLYVVLFMLGGALICCLDGIPLMAALFEAASAIGTVGLSLGVTPSLGLASRIILIGLMYFGRVGGLTMMYAVVSGGAPKVSQYPLERVTVG